MTKQKLAARERFFAKVDVKSPDECWLWKGGRYGRHYGAFCLDGEHMGAHRASWIIHNGPVPDGLDVLHTCDTPLCVNPRHLWVGTHTDNMRDKCAKGRHVVPIGHAAACSKLTEDQALEVFELRKQGLSQRQDRKSVV